MFAQNLFAGRTMKYFQTLEDKVRGLKVDDVNEAIGDYFDPDELVIATAGDFANAKPEKVEAGKSEQEAKPPAANQPGSSEKTEKQTSK